MSARSARLQCLPERKEDKKIIIEFKQENANHFILIAIMTIELSC